MFHARSAISATAGLHILFTFSQVCRSLCSWTWTIIFCTVRDPQAATYRLVWMWLGWAVNMFVEFARYRSQWCASVCHQLPTRCLATAAHLQQPARADMTPAVSMATKPPKTTTTVATSEIAHSTERRCEWHAGKNGHFSHRGSDAVSEMERFCRECPISEQLHPTKAYNSLMQSVTFFGRWKDGDGCTFQMNIFKRIQALLSRRTLEFVWLESGRCADKTCFRRFIQQIQRQIRITDEFPRRPMRPEYSTVCTQLSQHHHEQFIGDIGTEQQNHSPLQPTVLVGKHDSYYKNIHMSTIKGG